MSNIKIAHLCAQNFVKLRLVELNPADVTTVGGRNGQGKSSLMNAIAVALGGQRLAPEDPIRHGADEATIEVDLDGKAGDVPVKYKLVRTFRRKSTGDVVSELTITSPNTPGVVRSPQTMLDQLLGQAGTTILDPSELLDLSEKQLTERLMGLVGIDTETPKRKRAELAEERKLVHREIDRLKAKFVGQVSHDVPDEPIDGSALQAEIEAGQDQNQRYEAAQSKLRELGTAVGAAETLVRSLEAQLVEAKQTLAHHQERLDQASHEAAGLTMVDVGPLLAQLRDLAETNRKIAENRALAAGREEYNQLEAKRVELNKQIDQVAEDLKSELAAASFPVEGLGFLIDDEGDAHVAYNGKRWSQASDGEQLHVATAIALQMSGDLKIVLVRRAALWDNERRQIVIDLAKSAGAQIFLEMVGTDGDLSVVLEDGQVAGSTLF